MKPEELIQKIAEVNITFTPGAPINSKDLFAGRIEHVMKVVDAITRPGQHAIMYGERGVGKTSLANVILSFLPQKANFYALKINCAAKLTFTEIWRDIFRTMDFRANTLGFVPQVEEVRVAVLHYIDQDNPVEITPLDVRFVLEQMPSQNLIIIIDEFDRITDQKTIANMVDTIKMLSDYAMRVTLILVAVGDSVDTLLKEHASLSRALVQIQLPRMSQQELQDIIDKGLSRLKMTMTKDVKNKIIELSQGLPHYTHLLSQESVIEAIKREQTHIKEEDLQKAIQTAILKTQESTTRSYHKAITVPRGMLHPIILLGSALAKADMLGYFSPAEVSRALKEITNEDYDIARFARHLRKFATPEGGSVLVERGTKGKYKYRFTNPMMQPYIIMKGISDGKLSSAVSSIIN